MCRSIKQLRSAEEPPTQHEIEAAALQFVRKISGYRTPAKRNEEVFQRAVSDIAEISARLLQTLEPATPVVHSHEHAGV